MCGFMIEGKFIIAQFKFNSKDMAFQESEWKRTTTSSDGRINPAIVSYPNYNFQPTNHPCRLGHCHETYGHCQCAHCHGTPMADPCLLESCPPGYTYTDVCGRREIVFGKDINRESNFFESDDGDDRECIQRFNAGAKQVATCGDLPVAPHPPDSVPSPSSSISNSRCFSRIPYSFVSSCCSMPFSTVLSRQNPQTIAMCRESGSWSSSSSSWNSNRAEDGQNEANVIGHILCAFWQMVAASYYALVCILNYLRFFELAVFSGLTSSRPSSVSEESTLATAAGAEGEGVTFRRRCCYSDYPNWAKLWSYEPSNHHKSSFVTFVTQLLLYVFALSLIPFAATREKTALYLSLVDVFLSGLVIVIVRTHYGSCACY